MFFWGWCVGGGGVTTRWVCLHGITEKMKIRSYIHVGKNPYPQDVPKRWTNSNFLYSIIYLIWHPQNWRGARLLNILFIKQHLN
jgi:hypothetical protein